MIKMEFSNKSQKPFSNIYKELLRKTYLQYAYNPPQSISYNTPPSSINNTDNYNYKELYLNNETKGSGNFSIDSILSQESDALGDKMMNSAFAVYDRLKIHTYFNERMMYNWLETKNQILSLDWSGDHATNYKSQERRISSLESSLFSIEKDILQEKVKCWQDLLIPTYQFLDLWHKYQGLKEDKKLLE
jgi:hypothetical protein